MENYKKNKFNSDLLNRPFSSNELKANDEKVLDISSLSSINNDKLNISSISNNSKKRKPFDNKLSFSNSISTNVKDHEQEITNDETDLKEDSIITKYSNVTELNNEEKNMIITQSKFLTKDILEKAKLYNIQFNIELPFWIKFFTDFEQNNQIISISSSFFRASDKNKYVNNLIDMVKRDADLYEATIKHNKIRTEVKNNIKSLLITEVESKEENKEKDIKDKLLNVLNMYERIDKKENIENNVKFADFKMGSKANLIGSKVISINPESKLNKYAYPKTETLYEDEIPLYKTIFDHKFEEDDFKDSNYEGYLDKYSINKLLDIDRKLNNLDPERYNSSINTEMKKIKNEMSLKSEIRKKEIEQRYAERMSKVQSNELKKNIIFDVKIENQQKIKHKNYLDELKNKKKEKQVLDNIDEKIRLLQSSEVDKNRCIDLINETDKKIRENPNFETMLAKRIPEEINCVNMENTMNDVELRVKENLQLINNLIKNAEEEENKPPNEENQIYSNYIENRCNELLDKLNQLDNRDIDCQVDNIYKSILNQENDFSILKKNVENSNKEKEQYEILFKKYEDILFEEVSDNENIINEYEQYILEDEELLY